MTLLQAKKAVVSGVAALGALAAVLIADYDPSFTEAVVALVGPVFGVISVFASKNHTVDDLSKAVAQLQAAAVFVVGFFVTVPVETEAKVAVLIASLLSVYGVWLARNEPVA